MKIKTFDYSLDEEIEDFDNKVNDFIKDKEVVQITTNDTVDDKNNHFHTLTILYK